MLQKILDMIVTNGFVKYINRESVKYLKLGPTGVLLQENLKTQWCNNVVMSKELTIFPSKGDIQDTFEYAKKLCLEKVPFGIAETIEPLLTETILKEKNNKSSSHPTNFGELFEDKDQVILKSTIFVPSETSTPFFHQWQRQRRIWWRKFSASPGRYSLTDIKNHGTNKQSVDIMAEYPWGTQLLETIVLSNKVDKIPVSKLQVLCTTFNMDLEYQDTSPSEKSVLEKFCRALGIKTTNLNQCQKTNQTLQGTKSLAESLKSINSKINNNSRDVIEKDLCQKLKSIAAWKQEYHNAAVMLK